MATVSHHTHVTRNTPSLTLLQKPRIKNENKRTHTYVRVRVMVMGAVGYFCT